MSFFEGVLECNSSNDGAHPFEEPAARQRFDGGRDFSQQCGGCGVTAWGGSPDETMANAQAIDRANRRGRLA